MDAPRRPRQHRGLSQHQSLFSVLGRGGGGGSGLGAAEVSRQPLTTGAAAGTSPGALGYELSCWALKVVVQSVAGRADQYRVTEAISLPYPTPVNTNAGSKSLICLEKLPHVPSPCLCSAGRRIRGNGQIFGSCSGGRPRWCSAGGGSRSWLGAGRSG